ncbi:hypothetical protein [Uliginosibacterium sp. 31-12]|uniref:hypothetical protein n=1 Tax=Uliginosibacterium sp. 31-12 TaxID=3062781 RepID=UPI0026E35B81|nr:hypothetical protein [Uliginosibacterium sp. 31-12]MDO6387650.1 hypothetical protein [Uliginosibacterium sp. 31-12]
MKLLIESKLPKYGRFQRLEDLSKIKVSVWKSWWAGRQRATAQMVEAVALIWPEHAYWLATGDELPKEGLTNPARSPELEFSAIAGITQQVLARRFSILKELTGCLDWNAIEQDGEIVAERISAAVDKFFETYAELSDADIATTASALEKMSPDAMTKRWRAVLENDEQLRELESARERLMAKIFSR